MFTTIQQGTVNGAENGLTNIASLSWDECTKYIIETKHVYNTDSFIMDKTYFEALPEEYQTIIRDAAVEAGKRCTDLVLEANESIRPEVEAADCEFIETDVTLWQEALDGFLEEKYPDLVSYADQIKAADPGALSFHLQRLFGDSYRCPERQPSAGGFPVEFHVSEDPLSDFRH